MADHNDRTPNIPGPRQQSPAAGHGLPAAAPLLLEELEDKPTRTQALRVWWADAWDDGGVLHDRWEDLRQAPALGWHGMARRSSDSPGSPSSSCSWTARPKPWPPCCTAC
ncbi:hypothetical protein ACIQWN_34395 [Streptomyces vinaceus]|uniref:hypothetical protein n=1 Tax=Streptomyces vinaceus TaxID=1960 RepID=UPI0037F4328D